MTAPRARPNHGTMTRRGWLVFGGVAVSVSAAIIGLLAVTGLTYPSETSAPSTVSIAAPPPNATPLPDLGGPRSLLVPEVTLPVGAQPYAGKTPTPPGFEFWEVPGSHHDLVTQMRAELPVFGTLNGMPWCGEVRDNITSWAWGYAADTIGVSFMDGGVMITRLPQPQGCQP